MVYIGIQHSGQRQNKRSGGVPDTVKSLWSFAHRRGILSGTTLLSGLVVHLIKETEKTFQRPIMRNTVFPSSLKHGVYYYYNCY